MVYKFGDIRREKGLSIDKVVEDLNLRRNAFLGWERGTYDIHLAEAVMLANYYGVSLDYLSGRTDCQINDEHINIIEKYNTLTEKNKGKIDLIFDQLIHGLSAVPLPLKSIKE